jgi:hypothetical protein
MMHGGPQDMPGPGLGLGGFSGGFGGPNPCSNFPSNMGGGGGQVV